MKQQKRFSSWTGIPVAILMAGIFLLNSCHRTQKQPADNRNLPATAAADSSTFCADSGQVGRDIVYDVIIKNPNPDDTWTSQCLAGLDRKTLVDDIFRAIYAGRITATDFDTGEELSPEQVKEREKEIEEVRARVAKIQFTEDWYFDTLNLTMRKEVRYMVLGYEVYDDQGNVRGYKPVFRVMLNPDK